MNTKIKICGLKSVHDIDYVNELVPDMVGFVFAKSPRQITPSRAKELIASLNKTIQATGIFVNEALDTVLDISKTCGLSYIQLHGDESECFATALRQKTDCKIIKAIRVKDGSILRYIRSYPCDYLLLDAFQQGAYGGTGKTIDMSLLEGFDMHNTFLAGGLTADNVQVCISQLQPFAVDVSGGVETDGSKDYNKIKQFILNVRSRSSERSF